MSLRSALERTLREPRRSNPQPVAQNVISWYSLNHMKKVITFTVTALFLFASQAGAMTLSDVMQQYQVYKSEAAKNPAVLGASTEGGVPVAPATIPLKGAAVLLKALTYSEKSSNIISAPQLKKGMVNNDDVRKLQIFLITKGYLSADPTGNYYGQTAEAVRRFQLEKGINNNGTLVGPATKAAISADVAVIASTMD
jgi:murein L,D-transpeptidase YcbB/YkuD